MDEGTAAAYETQARKWTSMRRPRAIEDGRLAAFARRVRRGRVADLGCGPGWYAKWLRERGFDVVALDVAEAMLCEARARDPQLPLVCGDLQVLPFARHSLDGAWASACYQHLPRSDLPVALAHLHAALRPGAVVEITLANLSHMIANPQRPSPVTADELALGEAERRFDDDEFPGRLFSFYSAARVRALFVGGGFEAIRLKPLANTFWLGVRARRAHTLPDVVEPGLRLLICGLNPSRYSADVGVPFARPGNRFWPAMRAAKLVACERDVFGAFERGVGFTDIVKRATAGAAELDRKEYISGLRRIEQIVRVCKPGATCFVGLDGWRAAVDRRAQPGWIEAGFGGRPAYLMPSTSGRNARVPLAALSAHLRRAAQGPG